MSFVEAKEMTLGTVATYINGRAFKPSEWETKGLPIIRIQNLTDSKASYNYSQVTYEEKYLVKNGDLLFAWSASLGAHIWKREDAWLNQHIFKVIPNEGVDKMYLFYFLQKITADLYSKAHGTGMVHITKAPFMATPIPIPPIKQQQDIVAQIEMLFSQLDSGVESLKKTKRQLEVYRQAVLKDAFEKVVGEQCKISDACDEIKVGIVIKPTQYYVDEDGISAFRNANVRRGYIEDADWVMISKEGHNKNLKSEVHTGDVLISRSGANLGMASPVSEKYDGYNAIDVVIAVPKKNKILPEYLAYYTNSPMGRSIVKKNERGAAQGHLNVTVYGNLPIVLPRVEEQKHIIDGLEVKLSECDSIAQTIETALCQAETMRQSILKQAFEGNHKLEREEKC